MDLNEFLSQWQKDYSDRCAVMPLFDPDKTAKLSLDQRALFARVFYHARGHFHTFLWHLGSKVTDEAAKDVVLANIREEFGGSGQSHESLYATFAEFCGVNSDDELLHPTANFDYIQRFNDGHLRYIVRQDEDSAWSAFAAYERLDNVDYANLYRLAKSFSLIDRATKFFSVHCVVEHFQAASPILLRIWNRNPGAVMNGFRFIADHQIELWMNLGQTVFGE